MFRYYDRDKDCDYDFDNQKSLKKFLFDKIKINGKMTVACSFTVFKKSGCGYVPYDVTYYPATGFDFRSLR